MGAAMNDEDVAGLPAQVQGALKELWGWVCQQFDISIKLPKDPLFHYTSCSALTSILQSGEFWLHDIYRQNDPFEIRSGVQVATDMLDLKVAKTSHPGLQFFAAKFRDGLEQHIEHSAHYFLFCTSIENDDPYMWQHYSEGGRGVCIGLSPTLMEKFCGSPEEDDGHFSSGASIIEPTIYDTNALKASFADAIDRSVYAVQNSLAACNGDQNAGVRVLHLVSSCLGVLVVGKSAGYKRPEFSAEREYRFLRVIQFPRHPKNLRTKRQNGHVARFVAWPFLAVVGDTALTEIRLGPLVEPRVKAEVKALLKKAKLNVPILSSSLPLKYFNSILIT